MKSKSSSNPSRPKTSVGLMAHWLGRIEKNSENPKLSEMMKQVSVEEESIQPPRHEEHEKLLEIFMNGYDQVVLMQEGFEVHENETGVDEVDADEVDADECSESGESTVVFEGDTEAIDEDGTVEQNNDESDQSTVCADSEETQSIEDEDESNRSTDIEIHDEIVLDSEQKTSIDQISETHSDSRSVIQRSVKGVVLKKRKNTSPWFLKSMAIFFFLHPHLGNGDKKLSAGLFGFVVDTFSNWVTQSMYFSKWLPFVEALTVSEVLANLPHAVKMKLQGMNFPVQKVVIPHKFKSKATNTVRKVKFKLVTASSADSSQKLSKVRLSSQKFLTKKVKKVGSGRNPKYPEHEKRVLDFIRVGWEKGTPRTLQSVELFICNTWGRESDTVFWKNLVDPKSLKADHNRNVWIHRLLKKHNFSNRKLTISQKVPDDWMNKAMKATHQIRKEIEEFDPAVILNADETFLQFYSTDKRVIAQTGSKRVGTKLSPENEKLGATLMVTMSCLSNELLPPFIIFDGSSLSNPRCKLAKQWFPHEPAAVRFQKSHWMDSDLSQQYLAWIKKQFGRLRILLIWDRASQHFSNLTEACAANLGIRLVYIPEGLTSLIQPADIAMNRPIKAAMRRMYSEYVCSEQVELSNSGNVKVTRERLVSWAEHVFDVLNEESKQEKKITHAFNKCGLNPKEPEILRIHAEHLSQLAQEKPYAVDLELHAINNVLAAVLELEMEIPETEEVEPIE
jgi:hypothetical protein